MFWRAYRIPRLRDANLTPVGTDRTITRPAPVKELVAADFQVAQLQAALFTPDEEVSAVKLLRDLVPRWQSRFDAEPFALPTAVPGVPRQLPRLVLQQQSGGWRCEISSERITIYWQRQAAGGAPPRTFVEDSVALLNEYVAFLSARVGRMGAVAMRFAPHPQPGLFLARHFCSERWLKAPFNRPESFELHAHKTFLLGERFTVNSWVRNRTAFAEVAGARELAVAIEQDLNTPFEEAAAASYSAADVASFFALAIPEFDTIMRLYYPA